MDLYRTMMERLLAGRGLHREQARALMEGLLDGRLQELETAAVLTALRTKGIEADELAGFAEVMRAHAIQVRASAGVLDTCGTGGSGLSTLNTSTLAAFVAASAGAQVAKHGNRASSGRCGSMDVLEALGVDVDLPPARAGAIFADGPIVFLNARRHHPALGRLAPVRRGLGFRTVFNLLGPLCNPAGADRQLLGVSDERAADTMIECLRHIGSKRAWVVSTPSGLDEISLAEPTTVHALEEDGTLARWTLRPEELGLKPVAFEAFAGGDVGDNAAHFERVLTGEDLGSRHLHTALNAAAALVVAGIADDLKSALDLAREQLRTGASFDTFATYREQTRRAA